MPYQNNNDTSDDVKRGQDETKDRAGDAFDKGLQLGKRAYNASGPHNGNFHPSASAAGKTAAGSGASGGAASGAAAGGTSEAGAGAGASAAGGSAAGGATAGGGAAAGGSAAGGGAAAAGGTAAGGWIFLVIIAIVIVLALFMMLVISCIPIGDMLNTSDEIYEQESKIEEALTTAYDQARESARPLIYEYIKSEYPQVDLSIDDVKYNSRLQKFFIRVEPTWDNPYGCDISVNFLPPLEYMIQNISAYINATNATIAYMGEETQTELDQYQSEEGHITEDYFTKYILAENPNGKVFETGGEDEFDFHLTDEAKKVYEEHSGSLTNCLKSDYINELNIYSGHFFHPDTKSTRWDHNNKWTETRTLKKQFTRRYKVKEPDGSSHWETETYWEYKTAYIYVEDITINMYYDLSKFKEDEFNYCIDNFNGNFANGTTYEAEETVLSVQEQYYNNYIGEWDANVNFYGMNLVGKGHEVDYTMLGEDKDGYQNTREYIFRKLLEDGTLQYVPIWGFTEEMLEGEAGYEGYLGIDTSNLEGWQFIEWLKKNGYLGNTNAADYNCTLYVQGWLYEMYNDELKAAGLTVASITWGDGKTYVNDILSTEWGQENFYRGNSPAPGAVFSVYGTRNHTGVIENVYEKDGVSYVTYSDANWDGPGKISTSVTLTTEEFYKKFTSRPGSYITFANPKQ